MLKPFIHLRAHSDYSLGMGIIKIKELVKKCVMHKFPAICLSDHKNLFGSLEFSQACLKSGIQPIIGCVINIDDGANAHYHNKALGEILLIAKNEIGYQNLMKIVSHSFLSNDHSEPPHVSLSYLQDHLMGIILLLGHRKSILGNYVTEKRFEEAENLLLNLKKIIQDDLYLEIQRNVANYNQEFENEILNLAHTHNIPIVATNDVYFLTPDMHNAQDAIFCISEARKLDDLDRSKTSEDCYLRSSQEMYELFKDLPEAIENTINIAKKCIVYSKTSPPLLPSFSTSDKKDEDELITEIAQQGLHNRLSKLLYPINKEEYLNRLSFELSVIIKMKFAGYFLIVSDFIKWSKNNGIPVGPGRGSGAGSLVAWVLEITDLDPIKFGLLFERFLNPDRVSMPDFDIDFCQERREDVINYVKEKYGIDKVANIITFGKLQPRAVLRDVGRVLGIDYITVDRICKMVPNNPANPITLSEAIKLDKELQRQRDVNPTIAQLLSIGLQLEGTNRHVSTHAAGIVIADRPLVEIVPMYKDANSSMPIIQYNMKAAEDAGLVKFDFLGLKTLTVISWSCDLVNRRDNMIDINNIPLDDPKTYHLLTRGETVGVFQFESAGMKETIKKLKPDKIEDLVALGSLYRPGPMDNIPSYINRKFGFEKPQYLHPKLEEILHETYGIIVYQEQVIVIAQALAGYTLGEADLLRRAMGKKIKSEMETHRDKFIKGAMDNNGLSADLAEEIFNLIYKFASYGFNKSHAAAYAIISYQTAYLKANHTLEYFTASLNLEIHDTEKINLFINDARHYNIEIIPPCINQSSALFTIKDGSILYGLAAIKNVGRKSIEEIVKIRNQYNYFQNLENFLEKSTSRHINKRMLEGLIKSGSLDCLNSNRKSLFDSIDKMIKWTIRSEDQLNCKQISLFDDNDEYQKISLQETIPWTSKQALEMEFEALGCYLSAHPLEEYNAKLKKMNITYANQIDARIISNTPYKLNFAGVILSKKIKSSPRGKYAFLQISDQTGIFDISIFNEKQFVQYNSARLLEVCKVIFIQAEAKRDHSGLRMMVENITPIEEAIKNVKTSLKIMIKDKAALSFLQESIAESGIPIKIFAKLPTGEEVYFKSDKPIFIDYEKIALLKNLPGMEINEV